ncbi:NAD-dependent epimerase/dehydratase family protein [Haladaptatus caseinilyticus]|uniref:NAD-dependent epimerase/dehydratase family protein n=1 Tax=Haladaptatus caseinilyticus TaxID=2993314 RepID=UPI00224A622F|nr:NAD(P)-dependent oxidoreductase [Haladaptatus caseinilyticus]
MTRIAVTGAAGNVGRETLAALEEYDVTPITHSEHDDLDSEVCDVTEADALSEILAGHDVVVHLAANPSPEAGWRSTVDVNIEGTRNVFEAAREHDIDRVVFASSNHAVGMYNADDPSETETMVTGRAHPVYPDDPPRPDSYYGVSKVTGEALGTYFADRHGIEVVNLRIGWLISEDELRDTQTESDEHARFSRAMWLSPRDCRNVMYAAATALLPEPTVTAHATSRNDDRFLSLLETERTLGYRPRDNASEVLDVQ